LTRASTSSVLNADGENRHRIAVVAGENGTRGDPRSPERSAILLLIRCRSSKIARGRRSVW
jgi:hypothetical protein